MKPDVVVVGAGIAGLSVAYECARKGLTVAVVDCGAAGMGCSFGNAGMIVPSHFIPLAAPGMVGLGLRHLRDPESPFAVTPRLDADLLRWAWRFHRAATAAHVARAAPLLRDLHLASRELYCEWDADWNGALDLKLHGLLMLCKTEGALEDEIRVAREAQRLGIPAEALTPAELARLEPAMNLDVAGGVYFPKDAHLSPARLMDALAGEARAAGVTILEDTPVHGFRVHGRRIDAVRTGCGDISTGEVVLAAGARSSALAKMLGLALPLQAGKGYSLTLSAPRKLPRVAAILVEARVAITPMGTSLRVGGTMEMTGVDDERVDPARLRGIVKSVPRYLPDFTEDDFARTTPWCGHRPCSPDGLPYIGRFARFANLSAATGHAMMGISLGPVTGRLLAQLYAGEEPSIPLAPLSPDRYA